MTTTLARNQNLPGRLAAFAGGNTAAFQPRLGFAPARAEEPHRFVTPRLHGIALPVPRETFGERLARLALLAGIAFAFAHAFGVLAKFAANFELINAWAGRLLL